MAIENNGSKWQFAFWVMTVFLLALLMSGVPAIIANDCRIEKKVDDFKDNIACDITMIKISIARIEQKLN